MIRFGYFAVITALLAGSLSKASAQDGPAVQVMRVDKFELAPGIVTPEIARRFQAAPEAVASRIKGAVLSTLSQELSSSKLLSIAVRDESLKRLTEEWKISEQLGSGKSEDAAAGATVDDANYLVYAKIEDFVADYRSMVNGAGAAAKWKLRITISLEITTRKTGTKKVIKEDFEDAGTGIVSSARIGLPDFDSGKVRSLADGVAKKLGMRVLDIYCPPRVIQVRGTMFIVDRGRAAGMKEGQIVELTDRADDEFGTDAGFPLGKARVKTVKEETCVLELVSTAGAEELAKDKTKLTITRPVDAPAFASEPAESPKSKKR
jgi:hypothetical protein